MFSFVSVPLFRFWAKRRNTKKNFKTNKNLQYFPVLFRYINYKLVHFKKMLKVLARFSFLPAFTKPVGWGIFNKVWFTIHMQQNLLLRRLTQGRISACEEF